MKTPNLFLHFWTEEKNTRTFEEILQLEINPSVLDVIQAEILSQLNSDKIIELLPNFNWESKRLQEKWGSIAESMLLQVTLPETIWMDWIDSLLPISNEIANPTIQKEPLEERYPSFEELLMADIHYSRPSDSLEDLPDEAPVENQLPKEQEENIEAETIDNQLIDPRNNANSSEIVHDDSISENSLEVIHQKQMGEYVPSEVLPLQENNIEKIAENIETEFVPIDVSIESKFELLITNSSFAELKMELEPEETPSTNTTIEPIRTEKKVMDILAVAPEERVFESISSTENALKDQIQTKMTTSLAENIPLFLKLNLIQNLFDGRAEILEQLIEYVDHEAGPNADWKQEVTTKFGSFQTQENKVLWSELLSLIERKFS